MTGYCVAGTVGHALLKGRRRVDVGGAPPPRPPPPRHHHHLITRRAAPPTFLRRCCIEGSRCRLQGAALWM